LQVTTAISSRLDYFRELDSATRMLNLPGEDIVLRDEFITLISRLDECLGFLKANVRRRPLARSLPLLTMHSATSRTRRSTSSASSNVSLAP
jgi:hypothetical protein